ncbi:hypothetical protein NL676_020621 [Syzygium grande]|nr:hypothetical protein NL676_020621 [Syzygium grande]
MCVVISMMQPNLDVRCNSPAALGEGFLTIHISIRLVSIGEREKTEHGFVVAEESLAIVTVDMLVVDKSTIIASYGGSYRSFDKRRMWWV